MPAHRPALIGAVLSALCASAASDQRPPPPADATRIDQDIRCLVSFAASRPKLGSDANKRGADLASMYLLGRLRMQLTTQQIAERLAAHRRAMTPLQPRDMPLCLDQLIETAEMGAIVQALIDRETK